MAYIGKVPAAVALASSDVTDGIITNAKLAQDIISGDTALGAAPADTDELLVSDAGVLKRMDYSYIKAANTPAFFASISSNFAVATGTSVKLGFDQEEFDSDGTYDNSTNYRFTPATAGKYYIFAQVYFNSMTDTDQRLIKIYKNGSSMHNARNNSGASDHLSVFSAIINTSDADDYYEAFGYHDEGGDLNASGSAEMRSFFGAYKIIT